MRRHRLGDLSAERAGALVRRFEADYLGYGPDRPRFASVAVPDEILEAAAQLVASHGLRAYDGVQLASALAVRAVDPRCGTLASFDSSLNDAAVGEGFALIG